MVMAWVRPVPRSLAETLTMPLASRSKVTSICGTPRGAGRDAGELELAQGPVVLRHGPLALKDVDLDRGLAVRGGGEDLGLLGGDRGVPLDQAREHPAQGLDPQREGGHVEQQEVLHVPSQDTRLQGGAHGYDLVWVDTLVGLLSEVLPDQLLNPGHPRHAAHQHDLVDVLRRHPGVLQALAHGAHGALDQVLGQLLQLRARQLQAQVLRTLTRPP